MKVVALIEALGTLGGGEKHGLALLAPLCGAHDITVCYRDDGVTHDMIERRFGMDVSSIKLTHCPSAKVVERAAADADLFVNLTYASLVPNRARTGILMVYFPIALADYPPVGVKAKLQIALESVRQRVLKEVEDFDPCLLHPDTYAWKRYASRFGMARALYRLPLVAVRKAATVGLKDWRIGADSLQSYDRILANSEYTSKWVSRFYGQSASISYPPIDTHQFKIGAKRRDIVAVGRFDDGENSKKQHVLLAAFKEGCDQGRLTGWTLRLCGGVGGPESQACFQKLQSQAEGYPVEFYPNASLAELTQKYASASLFWHAMGYGEDPERHPWRCEHFGMTTAEAMSAGCIPMAYNAGGQPEVIGDAGYLWNTTPELLAAVADFESKTPAEIDAMRAAAVAQANEFGMRAFYTRTVELYRELGVPCRSVDELMSSVRSGNGAAGQSQDVPTLVAAPITTI